MTNTISRERQLTALGRYLTTRYGSTTTIYALACQYHLDEVYVEGVVRELRLRGQLAVRILDPVPRQLPRIPVTPPRPTEEACIARLDAALAMRPDPNESVSRLAWRYNLSRIAVRRHVRAAGWALPEFAPQHGGPDAEGSADWIDTIMYAHTNGRSDRDTARYLHVTADLVREVTDQHATRTTQHVPEPGLVNPPSSPEPPTSRCGSSSQYPHPLLRTYQQ